MNIPKLVNVFMRFVTAVQVSLCKTTSSPPHEKIQIDLETGGSNLTLLSWLKPLWERWSPYWPVLQSSQVYRVTMEMLLTFIVSLKFPHKRQVNILSLGSGCGIFETFLIWYLRAVRNINAHITCVDYSEGMIGQHQTLLLREVPIGDHPTKECNAYVTPVLGTMSDLSAYAGGYDVVLCINALQYVMEWDKTIQGIKAALSEKGMGAVFVSVYYDRPQFHVANSWSIDVSAASAEVIAKRFQQEGFFLDRADDAAFIRKHPALGEAEHRVYMSMRLQ